MARLTPILRTARLCALLTVALVWIGGLTGCGGKDLGEQEGGTLQATPISIAFARIDLGQTATKQLVLRNTGDNPLRISSLTFEAQENATIEALSLEDKPSTPFEIEPDGSQTITVSFSPTSQGQRNAGVISVESSDPEYPIGDPLTVNVSTLGNQPRLRVNPSVVRFPRLPPGERTTRTVTARNIGNAPLTLFEEPNIAGSSDFRVKGLDANFPLEFGTGGDGGEGTATNSIEFEVEYAPTEGGSDSGDLVFKSNEEPGTTKDEPTVKRIEVNANADSPCILVDKTTHNLGSVPLGGSAKEPIRIENCGNEALEITAMELVDNTEDEEFELVLGGERDGNGDGRLDSPVVLPEQGDAVNFTVDYTPTEAGSDQAQLVITNNDPVQPEATIDLLAKGATGQCPKTELRAKVKGSSNVWRQTFTAPPLDYIQLDGSGSNDEDGRIVEYNWRVIDKPDGSTVNLQPAESAPSDDSQREFRLLTAGKYQIGLQVKDNDGFVSCEEAVVSVTAVPDEKVHVELTWTNPEDPNENDEDGSDVDVHMAKMGVGKWFEAPYDIYYQNPMNSWNPETPSLDIDDTDGAGPENIQMDDPQQCQWYAVGVHYFSQLYGTAYATIRIYINNNLVYEKLNKPLKNGGQFWDVARIHWPSGQVYNVDTMQPAPPTDEKPVVSESMKSSGLCTAQELY